MLWEATGGLSHDARLDHGACSSAHRAQLPAGLAGPGEKAVAVRAYDWGAWRALTLQPAHADALAELRHPNLLPLLGVCPESRQFVYDLMPVSWKLLCHSLTPKTKLPSLNTCFLHSPVQACHCMLRRHTFLGKYTRP